MTAREQLRIARAQFIQADEQVYKFGFAKVGSIYRIACYNACIEAVIRFRMEQG